MNEKVTIAIKPAPIFTDLVQDELIPTIHEANIRGVKMCITGSGTDSDPFWKESASPTTFLSVIKLIPFVIWYWVKDRIS